jgi:23S rRNA (pseudouridine1915-N3)-methyltransferase
MLKIEFRIIGKTAFPYIEEGIKIYEKRLKHYCNFEINSIPDIKSAASFTPEQIKKKEGELILEKLKPTEILILLDENGKHFTSIEFSTWIEKHQLQSKKLVFQLGGAFGFSNEVYEKANFKISLSPMTFSHQMIRLFVVEQLYRAFTIIKGEGYHND